MAKKKGKKAWRTDISNRELDDYLQKENRDERSGGPVESLPDETLFFVDRTSDLPVQKRTTKFKQKILHSEAVLQRSSLIPPLLAPKKKARKERSLKIKEKQCDNLKEDRKKVGHNLDIWSSEGNGDQQNSCHKKPKGHPAVEVDAPGCSYNPSFEDHQEALGHAVAQEMQKLYQKELEPQPIPRTVTGNTVDEEDVYFLEVDDDIEGANSGEDDIKVSRPIKVKKLSRADLNRKKRRKEQLRIGMENIKRAKIQKDIARLDDIKKSIEEEQQMKHREWVRRTISKREKSLKGPPRLGKIRFQPEPLKVLLTEEVTGSLRKLKGCYTLAKERYNSLQKQGLIEPRLPIKKKARRKRIEYEEGTKGWKEREMHNERLLELGKNK